MILKMILPTAKIAEDMAEKTSLYFVTRRINHSIGVPKLERTAMILLVPPGDEGHHKDTMEFARELHRIHLECSKGDVFLVKPSAVDRESILEGQRLSKLIAREESMMFHGQEQEWDADEIFKPRPRFNTDDL